MLYDSKTPIYLQVVNAIKADIVNGKIQCGEKLPSGRELAIKYTINPNTSARVYQELENQGACFTRRGMGTYATEDPMMIEKFKKEMAETALEEFLRSIKELGINKEEAIDMIKEHQGDW
ncbi:MAG: GntR family transcriptional regulator [Lachnospiraceae bacterium]|nr:GntR family transcriptional regulator [Lachnospiraceae bacterium]